MTLRRFFRPADIRQNKWWFCLGVSLLAAWFTYQPGGLQFWRHERDAIADGQWWRIFTAHFVHVGTAHLLFNLLGLWLIAELLWQRLPLRHAAGVLTLAAVWIVAMLAWLHSDIRWYAGLSGVLHALWAACALEEALPVSCLSGMREALAAPGASAEKDVLSRWIGVAGLLLLAIKLCDELLYGPSARTERHIGAAVVADAHLYGAMAGIAYWLGLRAVPAALRAWRRRLKLD